MLFGSVLCILCATGVAVSRGNDSVPSIIKLSPLVPLVSADSVLPVSGGYLKVYSQRGYLDEPFGSLVEATPFAEPLNDPPSNGFLSVKDSSVNQITLELADDVISATGKPLSSFDVINLWTMMVKNHPAEGYAIFRHVTGIEEFIKGQEVIVRGFGVTDNKTVRLKFSSPDSNALIRLHTSRLAAPDFKLGPFYIKSSAGQDMVLSANTRLNPAPWLDSLDVKLGGESNPIVSFSLNHYDAILVGLENDLAYARQQLANSSTLFPLKQDRYFIACAGDNPGLNEYIRETLDPSDILHNFVKAEGHVISFLESDSVTASVSGSSTKPQPPSLSRPFKILFLNDDPPSKAIAEKLFADLTRAGLKCELKGVDEKKYEIGLVQKSYGCAIGYVSSSVLTDRAAQLRLASLWFNDQTVETQRLSTNREIPLFSLQDYLLSP